MVNQQFISFTIYHWLSLNFNNQIRSWVVQQNSRSYAVSKLKPADVKKNMARETTFDFDSVESLSTEAVMKAQFENKTYL